MTTDDILCGIDVSQFRDSRFFQGSSLSHGSCLRLLLSPRAIRYCDDFEDKVATEETGGFVEKGERDLKTMRRLSFRLTRFSVGGGHMIAGSASCPADRSY